MKTAPILLFLLLAACGDRGSAPEHRADQPKETVAAAPAASPGDDGKVSCAPAGGTQFERVCTIERTDGPNGRVLTLRAPDGGFRRLLVTRDGRGVVAADGAEPAKVTILSLGTIEVAVGRDRYRLPATMRQ